MANISDKTALEEKMNVINNFTRELKNSGYSRKRAKEILVCGLLGLERKGLRRWRQGQNAQKRKEHPEPENCHATKWEKQLVQEQTKGNRGRES